MSDTVHVDPRVSFSSGGLTMFVGLGETSATGPEQRPAGVPAVIPAAQAYYWTRLWQEGEAEALRELDTGSAVTFQNGTAAIRWLLDDDEDAQ